MMTEEKELCMDDLKMDLAKALAAHVDILKMLIKLGLTKLMGWHLSCDHWALCWKRHLVFY